MPSKKLAENPLLRTNIMATKKFNLLGDIVNQTVTEFLLTDPIGDDKKDASIPVYALLSEGTTSFSLNAVKKNRSKTKIADLKLDKEVGINYAQNSETRFMIKDILNRLQSHYQVKLSGKDVSNKFGKDDSILFLVGLLVWQDLTIESRDLEGCVIISKFADNKLWEGKYEQIEKALKLDFDTRLQFSRICENELELTLSKAFTKKQQKVQSVDQSISISEMTTDAPIEQENKQLTTV
jgi:hypothetical protein